MKTDVNDSGVWWLGLILWAVLVSGSGFLKAEESGAWNINLKDADISAFINQVSEITGKGFIVDQRVKGKVTVIAKTPLGKEAVWDLFLAVLNVQGFTAVPAGDLYKIVPNATAKQDAIPLSAKRRVEGQEMITRVITVKNSPAVELVPILRPLVPQFGHLAGVPSANAIIVTDSAENIARIEEIINRIDGAESEELELVELKDAWVGDLVSMLESLTPVETGKGASTKGGRVRLVADERTNRIIIKGDKSARMRVIELIRQLDKPAENTGGIQVVKLNHADAAEMSEILKNLIDGDTASKGKEGGTQQVSIIPDTSLNALVVRAEAAKMREIKSVIAQLDTRRAQVLIEAAIVEVAGDAGKSLSVIMAQLEDNKPVAGISFTGVGNSLNDIAAAVTSGTASLADGITIGAGKEDEDSSAGFAYAGLLQALATASNVNLLSTPSIMTLDHQEASIIVGENVPFVTGSTASSSNSNPFTTIQREDVGITLTVTPHINDEDSLRLEVQQESSAVKESAVGAADLITSKREIKTTILAEDGETIVLGGLISDDVNKTVRKVPLLGDLPLLGILFRATSTSHGKRNLLVFLRPTILRDGESARDLTDSKYLGIRAMQLGINESGDLSRLKKDALYPESINAVFREDLLPDDENGKGESDADPVTGS